MSPTPAARRARLVNNAFETAIAVVSVVTGALFLVSKNLPQGAAIGQRLGLGTATAWAVVLIVGGGLILWGTYSGRPNLEAAGLILTATGAALQAVALGSERGITSVHSIATFVAVGWACGVRAYKILRAAPT